MECKKQLVLVCPIDAIGASARLPVVFSGIYESYEPPPLVDALSNVLLHRDGHQKWPSKWVHFAATFC